MALNPVAGVFPSPDSFAANPLPQVTVVGAQNDALALSIKTEGKVYQLSR